MEGSRPHKIHILIRILPQSRNKRSWKSFRKGRLICGLTSSGVGYRIKRKTVRSPEGHMANEDFVLPWPRCNVWVCAYCWKTAEQNICSAFRGQNQESGTPEFLGVHSHAHPALGTKKLMCSSKVQECLHKKKLKRNIISNSGFHAILLKNCHSHFCIWKWHKYLMRRWGWIHSLCCSNREAILFHVVFASFLNLFGWVHLSQHVFKA